MLHPLAEDGRGNLHQTLVGEHHLRDVEDVEALGQQAGDRGREGSGHRLGQLVLEVHLAEDGQGVLSDLRGTCAVLVHVVEDVVCVLGLHDDLKGVKGVAVEGVEDEGAAVGTHCEVVGAQVDHTAVLEEPENVHVALHAGPFVCKCSTGFVCE